MPFYGHDYLTFMCVKPREYNTTIQIYNDIYYIIVNFVRIICVNMYMYCGCLREERERGEYIESYIARS